MNLLSILFLLTRPLRDVTLATARDTIGESISTHTPLAGRDRLHFAAVLIVFISTHTPLAGRDYPSSSRSQDFVISTHTPLAGRDMSIHTSIARGDGISTHTPLAGRDREAV